MEFIFLELEFCFLHLEQPQVTIDHLLSLPLLFLQHPVEEYGPLGQTAKFLALEQAAWPLTGSLFNCALGNSRCTHRRVLWELKQIFK